MLKVKELLRVYARANGYETHTDFVTKTLTLKKDGSLLQEEDILGTEEFAGFCDGYQGNPNRTKGPDATPFQRVVRDLMKKTLNGKDYESQYELGYRFRP